MKDLTKKKAPKVSNPNVKGNFMRESDKMRRRGGSSTRRRDLVE